MGDVGRCLTALSAKNAFLVSSLHLPSFGLKPFPLVLSRQTLSGGRPRKYCPGFLSVTAYLRPIQRAKKERLKQKAAVLLEPEVHSLPSCKDSLNYRDTVPSLLPLRDFTCLPCSLKAFVMHSCSLTFVGGVEVKHSISFRASEDLPEPLC